MRVIDEGSRSILRRRFEGLEGPVRILAAVESLGAVSSDAALELYSELVELSSRLSLAAIDASVAPADAARLGFDALPGALLSGPAGARVRFLGPPLGWIFATLIESIADAARGDGLIRADLRAELDELPQPVRLRVFTEPDCPWSPHAARLAQRLAASTIKISAETVCASYCRALARRSGVQRVPTVFVNDLRIEGLPPAAVYLDAVRLAGGRGAGLSNGRSAP